MQGELFNVKPYGFYKTLSVYLKKKKYICDS